MPYTVHVSDDKEAEAYYVVVYDADGAVQEDRAFPYDTDPRLADVKHVARSKALVHAGLLSRSWKAPILRHF